MAIVEIIRALEASKTLSQSRKEPYRLRISRQNGVPIVTRVVTRRMEIPKEARESPDRPSTDSRATYLSRLLSATENALSADKMEMVATRDGEKRTGAWNIW